MLPLQLLLNCSANFLPCLVVVSEYKKQEFLFPKDLEFEEDWLLPKKSGNGEPSDSSDSLEGL